MTELEALRAVAKCAKVYRTFHGVDELNIHRDADDAWCDLLNALDALDALPAPSPYETVGYLRRVLLYHGIGNGRETVWRATVEALPGKAGYFVDPEHWRHFATMTGPVSPPVVPVIAATVEPPP